VKISGRKRTGERAALFLLDQHDRRGGRLAIFLFCVQFKLVYNP